MQDLVYIGDVDPLLQHLVPVYVHKQLRHGGEEGGGDPRQFGALFGLFDEFLRIFGQESDVFTGPVLKDEGDPAGGADPHDGRRREGEADGAGDAGHLLGRSMP